MSLVDQVKRKLNISWSDEDTDRRVADIMDSAAVKLRHKLGITNAEFDFSTPGMENDLYKTACFYEWNHAANEFDENYANDIAQCRAMHEVAYYKAQEGEADAETEV